MRPQNALKKISLTAFCTMDGKYFVPMIQGGINT
jgi:hypothetical protein